MCACVFVYVSAHAWVWACTMICVWRSRNDSEWVSVFTLCFVWGRSLVHSYISQFPGLSLPTAPPACWDCTFTLPHLALYMFWTLGLYACTTRTLFIGQSTLSCFYLLFFRSATFFAMVSSHGSLGWKWSFDTWVLLSQLGRISCRNLVAPPLPTQQAHLLVMMRDWKKRWSKHILRWGYTLH